MRLLAVSATFIVLVAGCGGSDPDDGATSELRGLIVKVDGTGNDVRAFRLKAEGEEHEILILSEFDYGFDLDHLREHERLQLPVRVQLEERGGRLYALRIDDI